MAIHDGRQVSPLGAHFEVGDVAHPNLIEVLNRKAVDLAANAIKESPRAGHSPVPVEGIGSNAMLELQALVPFLDLPQLPEFSRYGLADIHPFGHCQPLSRLLTPTRQHERGGCKAKTRRPELLLQAVGSAAQRSP